MDLNNWVEVGSLEDFPIGSCNSIDLDTVSILIINLAGELYALENQCTHDGGNLTTGIVQGEEIICPRHGARFCIKTGAVTQPPAYEDIATFPVRTIEGKVQVQIDGA